MVHLQRTVACVVLLSVAFHAGAQQNPPVVTFNPDENSNGWPSGSATIQWVSNKWQVTATRTYTGTEQLFITVATQKAEPIRFIKIDGTSLSSTRIIVRGPSQYGPCGPIEYIQADPGESICLIDLRIEGDLGNPSFPDNYVVTGFDQASNIEIEGDVYGHILSNSPNQNTICKIKGDLNGDLIAWQGYPRDITIEKRFENGAWVGGNLYGDIVALDGRIGAITVAGDIGTPQAPVTISASDVINYISVPSGNLHAIISATNIQMPCNDPPCDEGIHVTGNIANTQITLANSFRDDFVITGGDFTVTSSINALHLADGAELKIKKDINGVGGSMLGDMYFTGVLGDQSLIEIDRSLAGNMVFDGDGTSSLNDDIFILGDLGAGEGLTGQIILNADATPINEAWGDGLVKFGPDGTGQIVLDPIPYYNNKSDDFGGGAVGEVPYYLHYADSQPSGTKVNEGPDGHENGLSECALFPHHIFLLSG